MKENLTVDMKNILLWFRINSLKANVGKFRLMILNRKNRRQRMVINSITVKESNELVLLGIAIDNKLVFKKTY